MKETTKTKEKILIRACHACQKINESFVEPQRCKHCNKSFLPLGYFEKVHGKKRDWDGLFAHAEELEEEDLIQGLFVLW